MFTPHLPWKFHANRSSRFLVMLLTNKQRNRTTLLPRPPTGGGVIMSLSKYNSDRQSEMSIWPSKPEIITSLELWQIVSKFPRQIRDFRWCRAQQMINDIIATTTDLPEIARLARKTSILQFPVVGRCRNRRGSVSSNWEWSNPQICRWNCTDIYHSGRYKCMLNHCLEWDKWVLNERTYPTADSGLTHLFPRSRAVVA